MPQCFAGSHGFLSQENRTEACLVVMLYVLVSHPRFVQLFLCLFYVILLIFHGFFFQAPSTEISLVFQLGRTFDLKERKFQGEPAGRQGFELRRVFLYKYI